MPYLLSPECFRGDLKIEAKEWDGRPARLFCFIRYGRDARATLCHDRTEHVDTPTRLRQPASVRSMVDGRSQRPAPRVILPK
jgi:hypothetical protein